MNQENDNDNENTNILDTIQNGQVTNRTISILTFGFHLLLIPILVFAYKQNQMLLFIFVLWYLVKALVLPFIYNYIVCGNFSDAFALWFDTYVYNNIFTLDVDRINHNKEFWSKMYKKNIDKFGRTYTINSANSMMSQLITEILMYKSKKNMTCDDYIHLISNAEFLYGLLLYRNEHDL